MNSKEQAAIERTALNFFRVHRDLNCTANFQILLDEGDRLLLPMDVAENWEICLLSCGDRLAKVSVEDPKPPAVKEAAPLTLEEIESEVDAEDERPKFNDPSWTKERLRSVIREGAKSKIPLSISRERKRKITDKSKSAQNPARVMQDLLGGNQEKEEK